jgi:hypothetical protein
MSSPAIAAQEALIVAAQAEINRLRLAAAAQEVAAFGDMVSPVRDSQGKEHSVRFIVNPRQERIPARARENIHVQVLIRDYIRGHPVCGTQDLIAYFSEPSRNADILRHMPEHKKAKYTLNEHLRYGVKELMRVGTLHRVLA